MRLRGLRQVGRMVIFAMALFSATAQPSAQTAGETPIAFRVARNVPPDVGVEAICCGGSYRFDATAVERVTLGFSRTALWLRIELPVLSGLVQLTPILDDVTMYVRVRDGSWQTVRTGDQISVSEREFDSPFMALPIPQGIADPAVFIRVIQPTAVTIKAVQWELPPFIAMQATDQVIKIFLLGFICAMILFNSVVSVLIRDAAFLLNACTISGVLLVALYLSGYGAVYIWPSLPGWSNSFFILGLVITTVAGSGFAWVFTKVRDESWLRGWPLLVLATSAALAGIAYILSVPYLIVNPWLLLSIGALLLTICGFAAVRALRGDARARILLVPLFFAMLPGSTLVAIDKLLGFSFVSAGNNTLEITLCMEAVLFSLALSSRIRLAERTERAASARMLAFSEESAARAIEAQDAERRRLAAELHDGAGQNFLFVLNTLKRLSDIATPTPPETIKTLAGTTADAIGELRRISRDMHPSSIEHLGLGGALEGLLTNLKSGGIETETAIEIDEKALSTKAKLHIYRVAQECLSNSIRHADASRIRISLRHDDRQLQMTIEDDGVGLRQPEAEVERRRGLGFHSITERARILAGRWNISHSELGGLAVELRIPIDRTLSQSSAGT